MRVQAWAAAVIARVLAAACWESINEKRLVGPSSSSSSLSSFHLAFARISSAPPPTFRPATASWFRANSSIEGFVASVARWCPGRQSVALLRIGASPRPWLHFICMHEHRRAAGDTAREIRPSCCVAAPRPSSWSSSNEQQGHGSPDAATQRTNAADSRWPAARSTHPPTHRQDQPRRNSNFD